MNYISPGPAIDRLLAQQSADTAAFRVIVRAARASINLLKFPLGSPAKHHDIEDIFGSIDEWLVGPDALKLENRAADIVAADRELEYQTRNDARLLVGE